jgi:hypothetical protein
VVGTKNSFTISTTQGSLPRTTLTESGKLPAGLIFVVHGQGTSTASATIGGIPAPGTGGVYHITIIANNAAGSKSTQAITLTVNQPPRIITPAAATFIVGQTANFTIKTTGFPGAVISGTLPAGISLVPNAANGTALITGVPLASSGGTYPITLTPDNGLGTFTGDITAGTAAIANVSSVAGLVVGQTISGPPGFPVGTKIKAIVGKTITLTQTPTASSLGATFNPFAQTFTITIDQPPLIINTNNVQNLASGTPISITINTTGFPAAHLTETGALPLGVKFVSHPDGTGTLTIAGTVKSGTKFGFLITASAGSLVKSYETFSITMM